MSQPHHFVFNEIERVIRNSVPDNKKLVDLLVGKNVLKEKDKQKFIGKNGMKCLTSFMRIKDFNTFVAFVECIRDVSEQDPGIDVSIVETIRGAVRTFDENHSTHYEDRIPQLKKMEVSVDIESVDIEPVLSADESRAIAEPGRTLDCFKELDLFVLVGEPLQAEIGPKGGKISSSFTDFEVTVPEGAVEDQITIKAVTCAVGNFNIPNDVYRISDYICIVSSGHLRKPATVQIAHCLSMPEYKNTPAIVIYHSDMTQYSPSDGFNFSILDVTLHVSSTKPFLLFKVHKFCIFCAVYRPGHYRGIQKQASCEEKLGEGSSISPYNRPTIPRLDYVLLFYEQQSKSSPYHLQVFSCINCPGAIEFCNKKMVAEGLWKKPMSKNFDFGSSSIIFMDVTEIKSEGWDIAIKSQCISECDIQRPDVTRFKGKKRDKRRTEWYSDIIYPPSMALELIQVSPNASFLKINIAIKDGKDGNCVVPGTYDVVLPMPALTIQQGKQNASSNRNVHPPVRSISVEEEQCLEEIVSTQSLARVSMQIKKWKPVAKELSLSEIEIARIEEDYKAEPIEENIYQMLYKWYKCSSTCRTYKVLVEALKICDEYEAVNFILGNIKTLTNITTRT